MRREGSRAPRRGKAHNLSRRGYRYVYLLPSLIVLLGTTLFPIAYNLYFSLTSKRLFGAEPVSFTWFSNYLAALRSPVFWHSMWVSFKYCVFSVAIELVLGFVVAYLFQSRLFGKKLMRTLIILPLVTTPVAVAYVFRLMLNPESGVVNYLIGGLTGIRSLLWFASPILALPTLILIDIWRATPFVFLVMSSAIVALPRDEFEAAKIDGASRLQEIWYVLLPIIKPVIVVILIFRFVDAFKAFDTIYALTGGGPGRVTETLNLNIYKTAFFGGYFGEACAMSVIMSIIILLICIYILKGFKIGMLDR